MTVGPERGGFFLFNYARIQPYVLVDYGGVLNHFFPACRTQERARWQRSRLQNPPPIHRPFPLPPGIEPRV